MEETLMHCAFAMAGRGTCERAYVGAVFSIEGRIISSGYNGAPSGQPHCDHRTYKFGSYEHPRPLPEWVNKWANELRAIKSGSSPQTQPIFTGPQSPGDVLSYDNGVYSYHFRASEIDLPACTQARHAEQNGIVFAARHGITLKNSTLFTTMMPCQECAPLVIDCGVVCVVAAERRKNPAGEELLRAANVEVTVMVDTPEVGVVG
jgi:deoxycytidylate deaminase